MRIYVNSVSTTSRPVLLFLAEHDMPAEIIPISLRGGEHLAPEFAAVPVANQIRTY